MSVLETPRLFFRGQTTWDPITTNNNAAQYDEDASTTVFKAPAIDVAAFRKEAIDAVTAGNWNPDGTFRSQFFDAKVTGFDVGSGPVTRTDGTDGDLIVGTPVHFTGMLVDLEPYGGISSQLFFDAMSFGIDGGCQIKAQRETRMIARYINPRRYAPKDSKDGLPIAGGVSVIWQTSFPTSRLTIGTTRSPVLSRFQDLLSSSDRTKPGHVKGLTVRWVAYRTIYFDSLKNGWDPNAKRPIVEPRLQKELQQKLRLGGFQPNPARSKFVGMLGLWRDGEPAHEPSDRALLTKGSSLLASAQARASGDVLTLDLSNSVPEIDKNGTKMNFGRLVVTARSPNPAVVDVTELGSIPYEQYCKQAYKLYAGIVSLHVPGIEKRIENLTLGVTCADEEHVGSAELVEEPFRAIAEIPNTYVDEGQTANIKVRAFERGRPVGAGVKIDIATTNFSGTTQTGQPPFSLTTDDAGIADLSIVAGAGSVLGYMFLPHGAKPPAGINPQQNTYALVRTLFADRKTALKPPTWDNVYHIVLRNWKAMAPCMDNWMRFDDEGQVKSFNHVLKFVTDPNRFESFNYMPVTRDMTPGMRTLLYRFLDADNPSDPVVAADADGPEAPDLRDLSRSLRQA